MMRHFLPIRIHINPLIEVGSRVNCERLSSAIYVCWDYIVRVLSLLRRNSILSYAEVPSRIILLKKNNAHVDVLYVKKKKWKEN